MSVFSKTACDFRKGYGIQMMLFRQKRKYIIVLLLCTFCIAFFAGCSNSADDPLNNDTVDTTENTAESPAPENTPEPVVLTEQELAQWTDYVNSRENNAFLLSYYDEPSTIDLNELFYTGCGLDMENLAAICNEYERQQEEKRQKELQAKKEREERERKLKENNPDEEESEE